MFSMDFGTRLPGGPSAVTPLHTRLLLLHTSNPNLSLQGHLGVNLRAGNRGHGHFLITA